MAHLSQETCEIIGLHWLVDSISNRLVGLIYIFIFHRTDQAIQSIVVKIGVQKRHSWNSQKLIKNQEEDERSAAHSGGLRKGREHRSLVSYRGTERN